MIMPQKQFLDNVGLTELLDELGQYLKGKQNSLTFDSTPTTNSTNPVTSDGIYAALQEKQDTLVSGTNIKTIQGNSLLGSGDVSLIADDIMTTSGLSIEEALYEHNQTINGKQETLVSGTNIKTINNSSLLGGGNLVLTPKVEYESKAEMDADSSQPNGTIGYDGDNELWYIFDQPNGEWKRIDIEEPNEISSITATESQVSGGNNVVTITETNGTTTSFNVKNGTDGQDGADGVSLGEIALVQTTGDSEESVMSQKAVSDKIERLTTDELSSLENMTLKLPDGYTMLDYISSGDTAASSANDGARIDTGLLPNGSYWRFEGSWCRNGSVIGYGAVITAYTGENYNSYRIYNGSTTQIYVGAHTRAKDCTAVNLSDTGADVWHTYNLRQGLLTLDGTNVSIGTITGTALANNLLIGDGRYPQKIGRFKAYKGSVLMADMIPARYGTSVGMYDIVREQFFTSSTSYDFIAGNDLLNHNDKIINSEGIVSMITQSSGSSYNKVMSQAATTEYGRRLTENELSNLEGMTAEVRLPLGYDEVEYIDSGTVGSAAQITVKDIIPQDQYWRFVGSWARTGTPNGTYIVILGAGSGDQYNGYYIARNGANDASIYVRAFVYSSNFSSIAITNAVNLWHTFDLSFGQLIIDGSTKTLSTTMGENSPTSPMQLGSANYPLRLGEFSAYHNDELVLNLVPCKHGNEVGMYDTVGNVFYTSANKNPFTAGPLTSVGADHLLNGAGLASVITQETGYSEAKILSQKATTNLTTRFSGADYAGTGDWVKQKMTNEGWQFNAYTKSDGTTATTTANVVATDFIPISPNVANHTLQFYYNLSSNTSYHILTYDENKVKTTYTLQNANNTKECTYTSDVNYIRLTINAANIPNCYIYDKATGTYLWRGSDYLYDICKVNLIDYKYFNEDLDILGKIKDAKYSYPVTSLYGRLTYFPLTNYPEFDPRTGDGISVMFTANGTSNSRVNIFDLWNPNNGSSNSGFAGSYFGLWWWENNIKFGHLKNYATTDTGGYSFSRAKSHYVFTYDFKTGVAKYYRNGVLYSTGTPSSWDEQTNMRDYLATCTNINLCATPRKDALKMLGIAVFGTVLTDSDVASIYGNGNTTVKNTLVPDTWKANLLHPIFSTDFTIDHDTRYTTVTAASGGGYIIDAKGTAETNWIEFGFNNISGLINNCIYDWDFTITSGSSTYVGGNYDRRLRHNSTSYRTGKFVIYDSNGNDVTLSDLGIGTYHVTAKPDNVYNGSIVSNGTMILRYIFYVAAGTSITIHNTLRVAERGAALECSTRTFCGDYWQQENGIRLPMTTDGLYTTSTFYANNDEYMEDTIVYNGSNTPQFNGQMAVDTANGKVYVGYLTGTGGTWKQINNS